MEMVLASRPFTMTHCRGRRGPWDSWGRQLMPSPLLPVYDRYFDYQNGRQPHRSHSNYDPRELDAHSQASRRYDHRELHPARNEFRDGTVEGATAFLCDHIEANKSAISTAMEYLKGLSLQNRYAFIEEAAFTLDQAIFSGLLLEECVITFEEADSKVTGRTHDHGESIIIDLNEDVVLAHAFGFDETLSILLHHMIHGFLMAETDAHYNSENSEDGACWTHGKAFGTALYAIKTATGLPLKFNHFLAPVSSGSQAIAPRGPGSRQRRFEHGRSTNCGNDVTTISETDCTKWYTEKCRPLINQIYIYKLTEKNDLERVERRSLPDAFGGHVEIVCNKQNVYISNAFIGKYAATLGKQFSDKSVLSLPSWAKKDMLAIIYQFLQDESYKPKLAAAQETREDEKARAAKYQAPLLREFKKDFHPYMLTDIKVYKLAKQIKFDELAKYAMKRLETTHFTHENPVDALTEIYASDNDKAGAAVDEKLRTFAVNFLKRRIPVTSGPYPTWHSNLHQLEYSDHRYAIARLADKGNSAFSEDREKARRELCATPPPPPVQQQWQSMPGGAYPVHYQGVSNAGLQPQTMPWIGHAQQPPVYPVVQPAGAYMGNGTWVHIPGPPSTGPPGPYGY